MEHLDVVFAIKRGDITHDDLVKTAVSHTKEIQLSPRRGVPFARSARREGEAKMNICCCGTSRSATSEQVSTTAFMASMRGMMWISLRDRARRLPLRHPCSSPLAAQAPHRAQVAKVSDRRADGEGNFIHARRGRQADCPSQRCRSE